MGGWVRISVRVRVRVRVCVYLSSYSHGGCAVVLLLQEFPDAPEVRELQPAGLQTAGAGDSVTLARYVGIVVHRLPRKIQIHIHKLGIN